MHIVANANSTVRN
jgi:hypothetical protein